MKRIKLSFLLSLTAFITSFASERDANTIKSIAMSHWANNNTTHLAKGFTAQEVCISDISSDNLYYVVTNKMLPGFVLVSADTSMPEILAFSNNASFTSDDMPEHVASWMRGYDVMRDMCQTNSTDVTAWLATSRTGNDDINPLLGGIEWGQDHPYNALCPTKDGKSTPSGCVATALSQIMMYHRYPLHGNGSIDYHTRTNNFHITRDFEHTYFDWDQMRETYSAVVSDKRIVAPIATLLTTVGAAVQMDYDIDGSGAFDDNALYGLKNYLGYDSDAFFADIEDYSAELWHNVLQQELIEGRPVYYTGTSGGASGHAFVIDGMQKGSDGLMYYHVNWGWDGRYNGYYLLNALKPKASGTGGNSTSNYSYDNSMICGIKPEDGVPAPQRLLCKDLALVSKDYFPGQLMQICIESLVPLSGSINTDVSLMLVNKNNPYESYSLFSTPNQTFDSKNKWRDYYLSAYLPNMISVGNYELRMQCADRWGSEIPLLAAFPEIRILPNTEWYGGSAASPKEYVGLRGISDAFRIRNNARITITPDSIFNLNEESINGTLSFLITDTEGRCVSVMEGSTPAYIPALSYLRKHEITGTFSRNMPNGNYWLCLGFRPEASDKWTYAYEMSFSKSIWMSNLTLYSMPFSVANGVITIDNHTFLGADIPWIETSINTPTKSAPAGQKYDLQGRRINEIVKDGVYIMENKKIFVK